VTGPTRKDEIHRQMTEAMKAGEKVRVDTLRMFSSAIRYKEDEVGHPLGDDEIAEVATKEVKKRKESIEAFAAAGRDDLVAKERAELEVIEPWAPARLDEAEVDSLIDEAFAATGATSVNEIGQVMGFVMGRAKGQVDGALVQQKVRARLGA
jgi:uncharacterized protein